MRATATHCREGHELTPDNVYVRINGQRTCKTCIRDRQRKVYDTNYRAFSPQQHRVVKK